MMGIKRRTIEVALVCALGFALSACDGVELNGKIFDALGVSSASLGPKAEPQVPQRSPLTLPPDAKRLPEPGSAPAVASKNESWPVDPEQKKIADAAEAKRKHQEYCKDGTWKEKAMRDEAAAAQSPAGSCGNSIFTAFSKSVFGKSE